MNTLKMEKKKQILDMLVEGCSVRSIERMTGTHRDTILKLLVQALPQSLFFVTKFFLPHFYRNH